MPVFKTLLPSQSGDHLLSGPVKSGWETWDSLDAALNVLGHWNWEIQTPLQGSILSESGISAAGAVAMIMVNRDYEICDEWDRQVEKLKKEIAALKAKFEITAEAPDNHSVDQLIREKQHLVDDFLQRIESFVD